MSWTIRRVPANHDNRLISYELATGGLAQLSYDSRGNLYRIVTPASTTHLRYGKDDELLQRQVITAAGEYVEDSRYYYDQRGLASVYDLMRGYHFYPHYNARGDVEYLVNDFGGVVARFEYTPWGETLVQHERPEFGDLPINQPLRYNGRDGVQYLAELDLYWMRARHYDAKQGRFLQVDPLPSQAGTPDTSYSYAGNDPVNNTDPTGMSTWKNKRRVVEWSHVDPVGLKVVKSGIEIKWKSNGTQVKNGRCRFSYTLTKWDPWYYTPVSVWQNVSLPDAPNMHECTVEHRNLSWVQGFSRHTWYNDVFHHYYNTPITDALNNISGFCANEEQATWAIFEVALAGYPKGSEANTLNDRVIGGCAARLHTEKKGINRLPSSGTRNADYPLSGTLGIKWEHKRSVQMKAKPAFP